MTEELNVLLRQARLRTPSPADPARPMSQRELAEALTAHVFHATTRVVPLDRHYVSRIERGVRRYPTADYRAAFRAVLGVATDAELGFVSPQRTSREENPVKRSTTESVDADNPEATFRRDVSLALDEIWRLHVADEAMAALFRVIERGRRRTGVNKAEGEHV